MIFKPNFLGLRGGSNIPRDGLIGEWLFSGNANDTSGNGNDGTVNGATLTTDRNGNPDSAYYFGTLAVVYIDLDLSLINITTEYTISTWFQVPNVGGDSRRTIIDARKNNGFVFILAQEGVGAVRVFHYDTTFKNIQVFGVIEANTWYHLVSRFNGTNSVDVFLNNNNIGTLAVTGISGPSSANDIIIGSQSSKTSSFMTGKIDDIRIYNRALTTDEITALYNE